MPEVKALTVFLFTRKPSPAACLKHYQFVIVNKSIFDSMEPVPGAARSNIWVYGRSFTGVAGSNSAERMEVCVL